MDSSKNQESFSFVFLKPKHFIENDPKEIETKLTPNEICKKLQEKLIDPHFFSLIEKERNLILVSLGQLSLSSIPSVLKNLLTSLILNGSHKKNILQWLQILLASKKMLFSNENPIIDEDLTKLLQLSSFDPSIIRKISFLRGKCNLVFKRRGASPQENDKNMEQALINEENKKPLLLKMTVQKAIKIKKIKKNKKDGKIKRKKKSLNSKKAETQTSESLSETSFNQLTIKSQKNHVKKIEFFKFSQDRFKVGTSNKKKEKIEKDIDFETNSNEYFEF